MCKDCFQQEIYSFSNELEYKRIENMVNELISSKTLEFIDYFKGAFSKPKFEIFGLGFGSETYHDYNEYECIVCNQKWKISYPDNAWRGFLLKSENYY